MRQEENGPAGGEEQEEAGVDGEREEAGGPAGGEEREEAGVDGEKLATLDHIW